MCCAFTYKLKVWKLKGGYFVSIFFGEVNSMQCNLKTVYNTSEKIDYSIAIIYCERNQH